MEYKHVSVNCKWQDFCHYHSGEGKAVNHQVSETVWS